MRRKCCFFRAKKILLLLVADHFLTYKAFPRAGRPVLEFSGRRKCAVYECETGIPGGEVGEQMNPVGP